MSAPTEITVPVELFDGFVLSQHAAELTEEVDGEQVKVATIVSTVGLGGLDFYVYLANGGNYRVRMSEELNRLVGRLVEAEREGKVDES